MREITDKEREQLKRFVKLEVTLDNLMREFAGVFEFSFTADVRRFSSTLHLVEPGIEVTMGDIRHAVASEAKGIISSDELCRWATMILLNNDSFTWNDETDEVAEALHALSWRERLQ